MGFRFDQDFQRYKVQSKIGEGTYGKVYKCVDKTTGALVAVKITKLSMSEDGIPACTIREICVLRSLKHPGIINLQDVIMNQSKIGLVFDFMKYDLCSFINDQKPLCSDWTKKILSQILKAIHHCHSFRIIHRDLKPQNILVDFAKNIKLADFGLARNFQIPFKPYTQSVQTLWYRAPELLLKYKIYDTAIDIWSVGCIFSELVTGNPLFPGCSENDVIYAIFQFLGTPTIEVWPGLAECKYYETNRPPVWTKINHNDLYPELEPNGVDLLTRLLELDPEKRISAYEALQHVIHI